MDGGTRQVKNPDRVPPILSVIDPAQEGLPRIVHPFGLTVGRSDPTVTSSEVIMDAQHVGYVVIEQDGTYLDQDGNPFRFKQGDRINPGRAARFPDLAKRLGEDVAEARMVYGAPQNRMEPPLAENRSGNPNTDPTVAELRAEAARRGIMVKADARKAEIVAALSTSEAGGDDGDPGQGGSE